MSLQDDLCLCGTLRCDYSEAHSQEAAAAGAASVTRAADYIRKRLEAAERLAEATGVADSWHRSDCKWAREARTEMRAALAAYREASR